jgi:hypothetical protein
MVRSGTQGTLAILTYCPWCRWWGQGKARPTERWRPQGRLDWRTRDHQSHKMPAPGGALKSGFP